MVRDRRESAGRGKNGGTLQIVVIDGFIEAIETTGVPEVVRARPELVIQSGGKPREISFKPNQFVILPGPARALTPPGDGGVVDSVINRLLNEVESNSPSTLASGGGSAASGHDRSLSRDYLETAMNQVLDGALKAYKFLVERMIESACWISEEYDVQVPIYANVKVPQDKGGPGRNTTNRQVVELNPNWVGEVFDVECYYPKQGADDIAMITILAQLYKEGLLTFYEFRERALGDEAPEDSQIALWIDQNLKSPEGKNVIAERTREKYGAAIEAEQDRLKKRGLLSPNGTPMVSLLPPSPPRPPMPPMMPPPMGPGGGPGPGQQLMAPDGPQVGPIPGDPNQSPMLGSPIADFGNMQAVGGTVAGATGRASNMRDSLARATNGLGIGETEAA